MGKFVDAGLSIARRWDYTSATLETYVTPQPATHRSPFLSPEDRDRDRQSKRDAVLRTAAAMFCERGYVSTQMDDVARQLGVTKPTIYYYFKNKEDVLAACFEVGFEQLEAMVCDKGGHAENGRARLRRVLEAYARIMMEDFGKCTVRIPTVDMSTESRARIAVHRRKFDSKIRSLVEDAVRDGSIPNCDTKIATFAALGALNWIAQWYRADGPLDADTVAAAIVGQVLRGLDGEGVTNS
jgi:AcrR family transcriptional regulator